MKEIIKKVLNRHSDNQPNLASESARDMLATEISAVLISELSDTDSVDEWEAKELPPVLDDVLIGEQLEIWPEDRKWIYESPDGGKTVYRRKFGEDKKELVDTKEWEKVLDVNLNGPFYLTRLLLKDMIKNKKGRIVNISSISGTDGNKGQSNYSASKGGLLAFTKSLAKEVGRRNITVNCIAPGIIETDMIADLSDTVKTDYLKRIPLKKFGKPEDIGKMILFLCSDEASYITGQTFYIDGGMSLN